MTAPALELPRLYPPHPALTWHPRDLSKIKGYMAQFKYLDWHTLVYLLPRVGGPWREGGGRREGGGWRIEFYNRHRMPLGAFQPPAALLRSLRRLELSHARAHVLDGGVLHHGSPRTRGTLVLWDILVQDGRYLVGTTYRQRYERLRKICGNPAAPARLEISPGHSPENSIEVGLRVGPGLWLAPLLKGDLSAIFARAALLPEIEGLVLKDPSYRLRRIQQPHGNASWMIRVRKPRVDYAF